jgi:transcriptional regulator with XRE-family HTH domain
MPRTPHDSDRLHSSPAFVQALGRTIKVIRTDRGIARRALAKEAGISYSYLTEIENGNKPPSSSVLGPIASALGLRMSQIILAAENRAEAAALARERSTSQERMSRERIPQDPSPAYEALLAASPAHEEAEPLDPPPVLDRFELELRTSPARQHAMQPSFRGPNRNLRAALMELEALLPSLPAEDVERLLDFARRLAR